MKIMKSHPLIKLVNSTFIDMPSPSSITFNWNFGSLLGITLISQVITGIFMTLLYTPDSLLAFSSIILSSRNIPDFWLYRWIHANGASLMFLLIYLHIGRNIYYSSFKKKETWLTGMVIFIMTMMIAFMGYVLPWGQMSLWGVTVITNLLSAVPYIGLDLVSWLWGGFSVNNPTLKRFFSIHFLLPFVLLAMIMVHLLFLHQSGSSNPLGVKSSQDMLNFHPFFVMKDLVGLMVTLSLFTLITLINPLLLNDPENFIPANPMITPIHIQPEWYFLFAYAILRSVPNKTGGVLALLMSIIIFFPLPFVNSNKIPLKFNQQKKLLYWSFITTFLILTWIGSNPVADPFIMIGALASVMYFILVLLLFFN